MSHPDPEQDGRVCPACKGKGWRLDLKIGMPKRQSCDTCKGEGKLWCALCGEWGDHTSGGCVKCHPVVKKSLITEKPEQDGKGDAQSEERYKNWFEKIGEGISHYSAQAAWSQQDAYYQPLLEKMERENAALKEGLAKSLVLQVKKDLAFDDLEMVSQSRIQALESILASSNVQIERLQDDVGVKIMQGYEKEKEIERLKEQVGAANEIIKTFGIFLGMSTVSCARSSAKETDWDRVNDKLDKMLLNYNRGAMEKLLDGLEATTEGMTLDELKSELEVRGINPDEFLDRSHKIIQSFKDKATPTDNTKTNKEL
jgi:hypothetical protein